MENRVKEENTASTQYDLSCFKRRSLRSYYREIESRISEGREDIAEPSSQLFTAIMNEVENIHQHVMKPRDQVADAEALLELTNILMSSVKSHSTAGVTPAEFVSILIKQFGHPNKHKGIFDTSNNISWPVLGSRVSPIFMKGLGCKTMIGPMEKELKRRKSVVRAKRARPGTKALPKELKNTVEMVSDTDQTIHVMFEILKRKKKVKLENLILNRHSFAQTIENLFALSFLVKDGRVHIGADEAGSQVLAPRNGPSAKEVKSGAVQSRQFVFRLDFDDWKMMKMSVRDGEEEMPERWAVDMKACCAGDIKRGERELLLQEDRPRSLLVHRRRQQDRPRSLLVYRRRQRS